MDLMKYNVKTILKHEHSIKWKEMQEAMVQFIKLGVTADKVFGFEIDANTHGSASVFPSKVSYRKF